MSAETNRVVVITRVHPPENEMGVSSTQQPLGQTVSSALGHFGAGQPIALGTVQIMIGLVMLLIGIVMASSPRPDNIGVLSGIFAWGSIIYVIAGSLTVAADNHLNQCLLRGSLGMNIVATITAFAGIVLHSLDTAGIILSISCNYPGDQYNRPLIPSDPNNVMSTSTCQEYWSRSEGISGVLAVFSFLEFIVTICISSFTCEAVCQPYHTHEEVIIVGNQITIPHCGLATLSDASSPPNYETVECIKDLDRAVTGTGIQLYDPPPEYIAVLP